MNSASQAPCSTGNDEMGSRGLRTAVLKNTPEDVVERHPKRTSRRRQKRNERRARRRRPCWLTIANFFGAKPQRRFISTGVPLNFPRSVSAAPSCPYGTQGCIKRRNRRIGRNQTAPSGCSRRRLSFFLFVTPRLSAVFPGPSPTSKRWRKSNQSAHGILCGCQGGAEGHYFFCYRRLHRCSRRGWCRLRAPHRRGRFGQGQACDTGRCSRETGG